MDADGLKLTAYLGERDRAGDRFLTDALVALYARHELRSSAVFRGMEGFGARHRLRTDRLLTLSEDLPVVAVAVDTSARIQAVRPAVERLAGSGLITVERARLLGGAGGAERPPAPVAPVAPGDAAKLTVYVGRQERAGGRPAHEAVVALLHRHGVAGATALLGVDGTAHGRRQRAAFLARNAEVPVMVVSVGDADRLAAAPAELRALLARPLMTLEQVRVCKRDGQALAAPHTPGGDGPAGQKLTIYAGEQTRHHGAPLYSALVRRLRAAGAAGTTVLRGFWGFHGDHAPHGERFWSLQRHVPVVVIVVDEPARIARWYRIVDALTDEGGLVTSELVPVMRQPSEPRPPSARSR